MQVFRGVLFIAAMTYGAFVLSVLVFPALCFLFVPSIRVVRIRRKYTSYFSNLYLSYAAVLLQALGGTKFFLYSNTPSILHDQGALIVSNHRTRIDWMFVSWMYGSITSLLREMQVILKDSIRSIPLYGWTMQTGLYIFLRRSRDADVPHISRMLEYATHISCRPSLLLFPEGTDLSEANIVKSNEFATLHQLPHYRYVLHPKPSGLFASLQALQHHHIPVHDVTIAYVDRENGARPNEIDVLLGRLPREVHVVVERYEASDMPTDKAEVEKWLRSAFNKKEQLLQQFYESKTTSHFPPKIPCSVPTAPYYSFLVCMLAVTIALVYSTLFRYVVVGIMICFVVVSKAFSGFDMLEITIHGDMVTKRSDKNK